MLKKFIKKIFNKFNYQIIKNETFYKFLANDFIINKIKFLKKNEFKDLSIILKNIEYSKSSDNQDIFVSINTKFKKGGFFVEFGAGDGINLSNTFFLEKVLNWKGVLCEPSLEYFKKLKKNKNLRKLSKISNDLIWSENNKKIIFQDNELLYLSKIKSIKRITQNKKLHNFWENNSNFNRSYEKSTITLDTLLKKYKIKKIDYLSIDTEGAEYSIIKNFNFNNYQIDLISIEHNFDSRIRNKIRRKLLKYKFKRIAELNNDDIYKKYSK